MSHQKHSKAITLYFARHIKSQIEPKNPYYPEIRKQFLNKILFEKRNIKRDINIPVRVMKKRTPFS